MMGLVGYARVSTTKDRQVLDCQLDALSQAESERAFDESASGAKSERPDIADCLGLLQAG